MIQVGIAAPTPALRAGLRAMLTSASPTAGGAEIEISAEGSSLLALAATGAPIDGIIVADEALLDDVAELAADPADTLAYPAGSLALVVMANTPELAATLRDLPLRGWGLVSPDVPPEALLATLVAATQGLVVLDRQPARVLLEQAERVLPMATLAADEPDEPLTGREQEVLTLLSQGLPNKQIARRLQISEHTVKFHVSSIYAKLGASSRTEAVSRGARRGLVSF